MSDKYLVAKELADIFKLIAHPDRIRLIEELRLGEKDVGSLAVALELKNTRVSQHLSLLRARRIVEERRDGRQHFYHLNQPAIASWIVEGLDFVEGQLQPVSQSDITQTRKQWTKA